MLSPAEALAAARMILADTARRLYGLDGQIVGTLPGARDRGGL
jgi:hypothetical protein